MFLHTAKTKAIRLFLFLFFFDRSNLIGRYLWGNKLACLAWLIANVFFFCLRGFQAEVQNTESLIKRLFSVHNWWWSVEIYSAEACSHCMRVWSVMVQRELNSLPKCLLVCNLMVMEWTVPLLVTIWGYLGVFLRREKFWRTAFDEAELETLNTNGIIKIKY